jgi:hypothetical protein
LIWKLHQHGVRKRLFRAYQKNRTTQNLHHGLSVQRIPRRIINSMLNGMSHRDIKDPNRATGEFRLDHNRVSRLKKVRSNNYGMQLAPFAQHLWL